MDPKGITFNVYGTPFFGIAPTLFTVIIMFV
jgi:hypothetical protein